MEYKKYTSPIGDMIMGCEKDKLVYLGFKGQRYENAAISEGKTDESKTFHITKKWLDIYFLGGKPDFIPPLELRGTQFRLSVWKKLLKIPYGKTVSYGDIAKEIAAERKISQMSARAVGSAIGHNPVSIIVPCHRVIGSNGSLTGYGGGIERKIALLNIEGIKI